MVRRTADNGAVYFEPPYTWDEEQEMYRRVGGGPVTVLHAPKPNPELLPVPVVE
jgi:hypothetical protein